jgi:hypothetical protein
MAKGELDALRKALGGNKVDPLQQTIFEKGPEIGFTPPAAPIVTPQEGRVVFAEPIMSVDPGINWYALGEQAFKVGGQLFEQTLDYLIDSKANALTDLSDMYRSKLDDAYVKLSKASKQTGSFNDDTKYAKTSGMSWKDVKVRPSTSDSMVTDGILDEINAIKKEWRTKADSVLENGKGNWYTPAIDYWDEALPEKMNSIGSKYQQLAVTARRADRTIMDQAEKLLFESQFASTATGKKETNAVVNKAINGLLPVATGDAPLPKRQDGSTMFHEVDPQTGQEAVQTIEGMPVLTVDDEGFIRFNSAIPPKVIWKNMNDEDFLFYRDLEQNSTEASALYSYDGRLTPMVEELADEYFSTPQATRDPQQLWKLGAIFAGLPPTAVSSFVKSKELTETDVHYLSFATDSARMGQKPEQLSKFRSITPDVVLDSSKLLEALLGPEIGTPTGVLASGATTEQSELIANKIVVPLIGHLAGLSEEEQENYKVTRMLGRITDQSPNATFSTFFATNAPIKVSALKAIAYFKQNPSLLFDEDGNMRSDEDIKKSVETFIRAETSRAGLLTIKDPRTNQPTTLYNPTSMWIANSGYSKDIPNLGRGVLSLPLSATTQATNVNIRELDYSLGRSVFGTKVDRQVFAAIHGTLSYSVRQKDGIKTNTEGLPQAEALRLALASHPDTWKKYKTIPDGVTLSEQEKIDLALTAYKDIMPATEWGINPDLTMRHEAFMSMENGGIALGFSKIPTYSGRDFFDLLSPLVVEASSGMFVPEKKDGTPALSIKFKQPSEASFATIEKNYGLATQNVPSYELRFKKDAPAGQKQPFDRVLKQVTEVTPIKNFDYTFAYTDDVTLTTTADAYKFINLNREAIKELVKNDTRLDKDVTLVLDDFGKASKDRIVFTDENLDMLFKEAQTKGVKTTLDFANYLVNVADAVVKNKEVKSARKSTRFVEDSFVAKEVPINFDDSSFFVPNTKQDLSYDGYVLYDSNSKEFFDGIKKYSMEGYNVYADSNAADTGYYLLKPEDAVDESLTLVLPAKTNTETPEEYMVKYNQVFGQRETDITRSQQIADQVNLALFGQQPQQEEPTFKKHTVLPSYMQSSFTTELNNFMARNQINFNNTDNLTDVLDVALFYDLPKLYYDTGSLPRSLKDLPAKYRLPGHSSLVKEQNRKRPSNASKAMDYRVRSEDYSRRAYKLKEAFESNNINQAIDALTEDPVAKLRTLDNGLTQNFNQDALNILLLAFEPNSDSFYKPEFETQYGVTKASFDKAREFAKAGWTPAAFEHQVRTIAKGLKQATAEPNLEMTEPKDMWDVNNPKKNEERVLSKTFNGIVSDLNPSAFLLDEQISESLMTDLRATAPNAVANIFTVSDIVDDLIKHPEKALDLKKEYLMVYLLPQARDKDRSTRSLKAMGIAKRIWNFYNKK